MAENISHSLEKTLVCWRGNQAAFEGERRISLNGLREFNGSAEETHTHTHSHTYRRDTGGHTRQRSAAIFDRPANYYSTARHCDRPGRSETGKERSKKHTTWARARMRENKRENDGRMNDHRNNRPAEHAIVRDDCGSTTNFSHTHSDRELIDKYVRRTQTWTGPWPTKSEITWTGPRPAE